MPSVCRRIAAVLALACLTAGPLTSSALAQDAGDQQYSDPFGGSSTTTTKSKPKSGRQKTTTNPDQNLSPLSPAPQTSGQGSSSGSSGSSSSTTTTPSASAKTGQATLPNTGVDARLLLLAGAVLLLTGLGLRLRTTPERF